MNEFEKRLEEFGLSPEQYEECLRDIRSKENKESDISWKEIVDKYSLCISPDTLRKSSQTIFGNVFVYNYFMQKSESAQAQALELDFTRERSDLRKERQKLFDERTALNRLYRNYARFESSYDAMKRAIEEYEPHKFNFNHEFQRNNSGKYDLIIHLTDIHCGMEIDTPFNKFNIDILSERLNKYVDKIKEIVEIFTPENAYVILGGDMIHGLIHMNARIEAKENVSSQIMIVADCISNFVNQLRFLVNNVEVHTTAGNHSRVASSKDEVSHGDNFDLLVPYICEKEFRDVPNITFKKNYLDYDIATFKVRGYNVFAAHGDKDTARTIVGNMTRFARKAKIELPDICFLGHRHVNGLTTVDDVKVIESGCIGGMDSYCIEQRLTGSPEQMVAVIAEGEMIKFLCDIQL